MTRKINPRRRPDWFNGKIRKQPGPGHVFVTTDRAPVFCASIAKCGSTYLKNVLYAVDHGKPHPNPSRIHAKNSGIISAKAIPPHVIAKSPFTIAVLRDPVDRFLSLYFDKVMGGGQDGGEGLQSVRRRVAKVVELNWSAGDDLTAHHENCLSILKFLRRNLNGTTRVDPNRHWFPQVRRLSNIPRLKPTLLTLDDLSWQLPRVLAPALPDIGQTMALIPPQNRARSPVPRAALRTAEIRAAVWSVYGADAVLYTAVKSQWAQLLRQEEGRRDGA